ncbi:MAG: D-cysteine desulfhydrase family protein [Enterocloster asparagiformis]|nr:D-cysteine desulfhydrase family protein [Enterocloster asparagiformis]
MESITEIRGRLERLGKLHLGFYPTPLHRLDRISEEYGVELYVKREDFSGMTLFGGNKIRKLEYLLRDAMEKGCDTVVTYGATQSNHAMETATAARKCGLNPVLFLAAIVTPDEADIRANLLLDTILGAEINIIPANGRSTKQTMEESQDLIQGRIRELEAQGHKVYNIPTGGSLPLGACGFVDAFVETMEQAGAIGLKPDYLFTATGSTGTLSGLCAGKALMGSGTKLVGIAVGPKPADYAGEVVSLANEALGLLGAKETVTPDLFTVCSQYYGDGYEVPSPAANDDIRYLARTEGIFTDPVYSGKSFHGMMEHIRDGRVPKGSTVIYLHTGGATALFSESGIIGDLNCRKPDRSAR